MNNKIASIIERWKFLKLSIRIFIISPFPAPSSIILNFFGEPRLCQKLIIQIAKLSEKSLDMFGAVMKSPFLPKGFFSYSNQTFYDRD